jgi:hypothetical protein
MTAAYYPFRNGRHADLIRRELGLEPREAPAMLGWQAADQLATAASNALRAGDLSALLALRKQAVSMRQWVDYRNRLIVEVEVRTHLPNQTVTAKAVAQLTDEQTAALVTPEADYMPWPADFAALCYTGRRS